MARKSTKSTTGSTNTASSTGSNGQQVRKDRPAGIDEIAALNAAITMVIEGYEPVPGETIEADRVDPAFYADALRYIPTLVTPVLFLSDGLTSREVGLRFQQIQGLIAQWVSHQNRERKLAEQAERRESLQYSIRLLLAEASLMSDSVVSWLGQIADDANAKINELERGIKVANEQIEASVERAMSHSRRGSSPATGAMRGRNNSGHGADKALAVTGLTQRPSGSKAARRARRAALTPAYSPDRAANAMERLAEQAAAVTAANEATADTTV